MIRLSENDSWDVPFCRVDILGKVFTVTAASIVATLIGFIPVVLYLWSKSWLLNNLFGIIFSINALKYASDFVSWRWAFLLLWGLFFYDMFFVYQTDVMVTVAKTINLPIKLQFPIPLLKDGREAYSILGLGDIIVPGFFASFCLKSDVDCFLASKPRIIE